MKRIVIVRLDHLGDLLLVTPLIRAFHKGGWSVDMVVPRWLAPVFANNPHVAETTAIEDISADFPSHWWHLAHWLRSRDYEMVLLPNANQRQQLFASLFSGIPQRFAMWSGLWGRLTLHRCLRSSIRENPRPFADVLLDLGRAAGVPTDGLRLDFFSSTEEIALAGEWLGRRGFGGAGVLIGVHPGCAGNTCNLPPESYGKIVELLLARDNAYVLATGSHRERKLVESWPERVRKSARFIDAVGELSLRELAAVIGKFKAYVIPSTGPLHLASALGVATISPFCGWSTLSPDVWGNQNGRGQTVRPAVRSCNSWRAANPGSAHCDFRGEVTAEMIVERVVRILEPV